MDPLISVIVPIYNVSQYLNKCLDSILEQTYQNLEIILVDDGSPDDCGLICDDYAKKDNRIKVIHKKNGGLSDARNFGLDIASGKYIGFVDSDDWIKPDMFEYLYNGIKETGADVSVCNVINSTKYRLRINRYEEQVVESETFIKMLFSDEFENYAWNKLYKSSLWDNIRFPVGKNFEDMLTIYKAVECANKVSLLPDGKYYYRIRQDSISGARDYTNRLHIYQAVCDRYEDAVLRFPQYRNELFFRIRRYYIHELSSQIVRDLPNRELNWTLLVLLSDFVRKHKDEIFAADNFSFIEKRKINNFCKCSLRGCKNVMIYQRLLNIRGGK